VCVCCEGVWVWERERGGVCMCEIERERERGSVGEWGRGRRRDMRAGRHGLVGIRSQVGA
jgi:hypothetical protein